MYFDLHKLWFVTGTSTSRIIILVQEIMDIIESDMIEVLPVAHASTGCDSTSKVASKNSTLRVAMESGYELLYSFERSELTDQLIAAAEKFLIK